MDNNEIRQLYAVAMSYDNRDLSEANLMAWREQATRNRWTLDEAREAIHTHHAQSTEYLKPAHITTIVKARRQQPAPIDAAQQLETPPAAHPEHVTAIMAELGQQLGWRKAAEGSEKPPAVDVECPWCHAAPNRPCTRRITQGPHRGEDRPLKQNHPSRTELAEKAMA